MINLKTKIIIIIIILAALTVGIWFAWEQKRNSSTDKQQNITIDDVDILFGEGDVESLQQIALNHNDPYIKERALLSVFDLSKRNNDIDGLKSFLQTASQDDELRQLATVSLSYLQKEIGSLTLEVATPEVVELNKSSNFKAIITSKETAKVKISFQDFLYKDNQGEVMELAPTNKQDFPLQFEADNKMEVEIAPGKTMEFDFALTPKRVGKYRFIVKTEAFFEDGSQLSSVKVVILLIENDSQKSTVEVVEID